MWRKEGVERKRGRGRDDEAKVTGRKRGERRKECRIRGEIRINGRTRRSEERREDGEEEERRS